MQRIISEGTGALKQDLCVIARDRRGRSMHKPLSHRCGRRAGQTGAPTTTETQENGNSSMKTLRHPQLNACWHRAFGLAAAFVLISPAALLAQHYRFLYVADLKQGKIRVYDTNFNPVRTEDDAFDDYAVPHGFAPFNVQNIGGNLYVTYAQQNQAKNFVVFGAGLGFVDVFSPHGRLLQRLEHGNWLNAPWGLTLAPSDFGQFSHKLIVGQFGSGELLAFDAVTGRFEGELLDSNGKAIVIDGLWGISFGAGQPSSGQPPVQASGPGNSLFFAAGPNRGNDGLFGTITALELIEGNGQ